MGELEVVQGKVFDVIGVQDLVIQEMNAKALTLKINGIEDKKGKQEVHELRMLYVTTRNNVIRHGKAKRESAIKYQKDVIIEEKRVLELLAKGESHLGAEEKAVDDALEAIKQEKIRQQELIIQGRRDRLAALGVGFNGVLWQFNGATLVKALPEALLKTANDQQFETFVQEFETVIREEKRIKVEAEAKRKEEAEQVAKIAAEQEAERKRLEDEKARLAEEERKAAQRLRLEEAERQKAEEALRAERDRTRREQEEWAAIKKAELDAIEAAKQKAIKDEADRKQKEIDDKRRAEELEQAKKEAAEKAVKEAEEFSRQNALKLAEQDRLAKIAAEKKEARRPDKERLLAFAKTEYFFPDMKTDDGRQIILNFKNGLAELVKTLKHDAEVL